MVEVRRLGLVLILISASLAGCIGAEDADVAADGTDEAKGSSNEAVASSGVATLDTNTTIEGPDWQVGQWFGYHVFFGVNDTEGIHYESAVISETSDRWRLAPADPFLSKYDAVYDLPFVGSFDKADLSTTEAGEPFQWYDWPLFDGKNYTETVQGYGDSFEVSYTVDYDPAIPTKDGEHPGFSIVGETADGETYVEYDYVPHIGWFAHLFLYPLDGETDDDWELHIMTMGAGENWTGTAYVDEATLLVEHFNAFAPGAASPHASFAVTDEATHTLGLAWSGAYTGAHETMLVDPNGTAHPMTAIAPPMSFQATAWQWVGPAIPGEWQIATAGAGQFAGGGVTAYETVETAIQMENGEPVSDVNP